MLKLGLDLGSSYTKGVLVNDKNILVDQHVVKTGFDFKRGVRHSAGGNPVRDA